MADDQVGAFKKEEVTNSGALAQNKSLRTHEQEGVDFGFIVWIIGALALIGGGMALARRSAILGYGLVALTAALSVLAVAAGVLQERRDWLSAGFAGAGVAIAMAGGARYLRRNEPRAPKPSRPRPRRPRTAKA